MRKTIAVLMSLVSGIAHGNDTQTCHANLPSAVDYLSSEMKRAEEKGRDGPSVCKEKDYILIGDLCFRSVKGYKKSDMDTIIKDLRACIQASVDKKSDENLATLKNEITKLKEDLKREIKQDLNNK